MTDTTPAPVPAPARKKRPTKCLKCHVPLEGFPQNDFFLCPACFYSFLKPRAQRVIPRKARLRQEAARLSELERL